MHSDQVERVRGREGEVQAEAFKLWLLRGAVDKAGKAGVGRVWTVMVDSRSSRMISICQMLGSWIMVIQAGGYRPRMRVPEFI